MKENDIPKRKNFILRFFLASTILCFLSSYGGQSYAQELLSDGEGEVSAQGGLPTETVAPQEAKPDAAGGALQGASDEDEVEGEGGLLADEEPVELPGVQADREPSEEAAAEELTDDGVPNKASWPKDTVETIAEVFIEESTTVEGAGEKAVETELVDAPPIEPEGSEEENNIFGKKEYYFVTIPKHMAFRKLPNGNYETVESSRYTVNSGLSPGYQLSVRVAGINVDDTVQLSDSTDSVHRKVEVSTMAYNVWKYRPDGTRLTVNEADSSGYGRELVLEGPGKFYAKCRLSKFGDDTIHAGKWTGSILFTVSCTPEPDENPAEDSDGEEESGSALGEGQQKMGISDPGQSLGEERLSEPEDQMAEPKGLPEASTEGMAVHEGGAGNDEQGKVLENASEELKEQPTIESETENASQEIDSWVDGEGQAEKTAALEGEGGKASGNDQETLEDGAAFEDEAGISEDSGEEGTLNTDLGSPIEGDASEDEAGALEALPVSSDEDLVDISDDDAPEESAGEAQF